MAETGISAENRPKPSTAAASTAQPTMRQTTVRAPALSENSVASLAVPGMAPNMPPTTLPTPWPNSSRLGAC